MTSSIASIASITSIMPPIMLVRGEVAHTRFAPPHHFSRPSLSLWIDLDALPQAAKQYRLFSHNRFNLLSLYESDYLNHPNYNHADAPSSLSLASRIRHIAAECIPKTPIAGIRLLTFPRILGMVFNPLSVYECTDKRGSVVMQVFEVRNTFGESHIYVAATSDPSTPQIYTTDKRFYVSPFFPVAGKYRLHLKHHKAQMRLLVGYDIDGKPALRASLRGTMVPLTDRALVGCMQLPMGVWVGIHYEAVRLWLKKAKFFRRPTPPAGAYSMASAMKERKP